MISVDVPAQPYPGLTEDEAAARLRRDGPNELPSNSSRGWGAILAGVFREPMFLLLVAGCAIYLMLGDRSEALFLFASVLAVIAITVYQERKTERALEALRELSSPRALVLRAGRRRRIPGRDVVVGDLVLLAEGDRVPADAVAHDCQALSADESLLTGESLPVSKQSAPERLAEFPEPGGEQTPFLYSGTLIVSGHGAARVVATGPRSHIGRIGASLESIRTEQTPLQVQTARAVRAFALLGLAACLLVVVLHRLSGTGWLDASLAGITLAMAVLPEEFPVVLTVFLALGAWRISRQKVLTRRMPAIETLGSATVLCVDKTGTLTENRMVVAELSIANRQHESGQGVPPPDFGLLLRNAALACERDPFDPMEQAIVSYACAHDVANVRARESGRLVREYDLTRDLLAVTHCWQLPGVENGTVQVATKGAPEAIADLCGADAARREWILDQTSRMAAKGRRVVGVAVATWRGEGFPDSPRAFDFEFLGLVGLADPVRSGVAQAMRDCSDAGIRVVMITGDYPGTALAIAGEIGLSSDGVISGAELACLSPSELRARARQVNVFARVLPEQKLALVNAIKANGEIVAMTGDGVNDAPALKAAHIGVAMGGRGTDVAREAASLVLLEDDFGSIVHAVRLGRRIYDNIRHAMTYLIAVHVPTAGMVLVPLLFGWPPLLAPVHIVFLEFVIDPACSFAFEAEPAHPATMKRPPRDPRQALFGARLLAHAVLQGLLVLFAVALLYYIVVGQGLDPERSRAMAFAALVLGNAALILVNRSRSRDPLQTLRMPNAALWWVIAGALAGLAAALYVPTLQSVFGFESLSASDLAAAALPALAVLACVTIGRRAFPAHAFSLYPV